MPTKLCLGVSRLGSRKRVEGRNGVLVAGPGKQQMKMVPWQRFIIVA